MKNNLYYFKFSITHPETALDSSFVFIGMSSRLDEIVKNVKDVKEILTAIKVMLEKKESSSIIEKYYTELQNILCSYSNRSEFICFAHACDTTLNAVKKDYNLLKKVTLLYLKNRDITNITPREWVQALIDSQSSRKKGHAGENKLIAICKRYEYEFVNDWEGFEHNQKAVAQFAKTPSNPFYIPKVRQKLGIILPSDQEKAPDLLIKNKDKWVILEAKHINTSGGEQNKQIAELIRLISIVEKHKNVHYVAFMDGAYSNKLLKMSDSNIANPDSIEGKGHKSKEQQKQIIFNLKANQRNFWLNTAGFIEFIGSLDS